MSTIPATIWMGDLEPYMDDNFIILAFEQMGVQVKNVKMKNKNQSDVGSYCFVELADQMTAQRTMLSLSNKVIPMTNPPIRFKLNHASYGREHLAVPEYSLFVGELTEDVTDLMLFDAFAKRYTSVRNAKVVYDKDGVSKGFGFVRFTDENDRKLALNEMQHYRDLGGRRIRVSIATAKSRHAHTYPSTKTDPYAAYYHQQYYAQQWPGYHPASSGQYGYGTGHGEASSYYGNYGQSQGDLYNPFVPSTDDDDEELVDPDDDVNVEQQNRLFMERSEELYTALQNSAWVPVDNVYTKLTPEMVS